ncbi:hypothetical protein IAT38_004092 [Cryptococcus sp. DSM 104549]
MSAPAKIVLITGANRGIGLGLAKVYLEKGWTVVAAARDLSKLPKLEGTVIPVKIDSGSLTDAKEAVEELKTKHNITHLDVVIANAGIAHGVNNVSHIDVAYFDKIQETNVRGPLILYQAVHPLLQEGAKFTVISSAIGANSPDHLPGYAAYATSKAAVNFLFRNAHFEEPKLTIFTISPGFVDTDMGHLGAQNMGLERATLDVEESVYAVVKLVDGATRETHGGYMWDYDGTKLPW